MEILNTLNSVKNIHKQCIIQNFITTNVIKPLAEKHTEGLYEECDKFCLGRNYMWSKCVEYLDRWMKPTQDFSGFTWIPLVSHWNGIKQNLQSNSWEMTECQLMTQRVMTILLSWKLSQDVASMKISPVCWHPNSGPNILQTKKMVSAI
jgi:hypothetical protein